jgi:glycosyltransferase involved in cell wall biosynthesis
MSRSLTDVSFASPPARLVAGLRRRNAIGIVAPSYGSEKVSYGLAPAGYTFHKVTRVPLHRFERSGTFWHQTPLLLDYPVALVHTFNELPVGLRPFVVSFENELPRYLGEPAPWQLDAGYALIASPRCRGVLALSEAAAAGLRRRLAARGLGDLDAKVSVFRGSVLAPPDEGDERRVRAKGEPLRVLFVGRDALRKGLPPTLDALDACAAAGAQIETTVVCDFADYSYVGAWTAEDTARTLERMRAMPGLTYHERVPNVEIQRLMRSHDVLAFPTLDESLGWVAIEAAMAGLPVLTTNIFAIPELVIDGRTGILAALDKNESSRWVGLWLSGAAFDDALDRAFAAIRTMLTNALLRFSSRPDEVRALGDSARMHIGSLYDLDGARRALACLYADALER